MTWAIAVREQGWSLADAVTILGFAIAAGRRGFWIAPPAIGIAALGAQLGESKASWSFPVLLALLVVKGALLVLLAARAERDAQPREPEPDRALAALRRCELCAWIWIAYGPIGALAWWASPTVPVSVGFAAAYMIVAAVFAQAAFSNARAALVQSPRWLWCAAAMFTMWQVARTFRTWALTFARYWGDIGAVPLKPVGWYAHVPAVLAALCALVALVVFAQRSAAREARRAALAAIVFEIIAFGVTVGVDGPVAHVAMYMLADLAAVLAYRSARSAIHGGIPRARVSSRSS